MQFVIHLTGLTISRKIQLTSLPDQTSLWHSIFMTLVYFWVGMDCCFSHHKSHRGDLITFVRSKRYCAIQKLYIETWILCACMVGRSSYEAANPMEWIAQAYFSTSQNYKAARSFFMKYNPFGFFQCWGLMFVKWCDLRTEDPLICDVLIFFDTTFSHHHATSSLFSTEVRLLCIRHLSSFFIIFQSHRFSQNRPQKANVRYIRP